mmetsp:Transcript_115248/g.223989  ORF Transcript_115248/g.223989 Transcript_115248/m.223989 type:complete len:515 (+) Transcript_115248:45-1589(+)
MDVPAAADAETRVGNPAANQATETGATAKGLVRHGNDPATATIVNESGFDVPPVPGRPVVDIPAMASEVAHAVLQAQVIHKRTYGNRLVFLDLDTRNLLEHKQCNEVVFSFEVYGDTVRAVRKDICPGDIVQFKGRFRPCGSILDAMSYAMIQRWSDAGTGMHFNAGSAQRLHKPNRRGGSTAVGAHADAPHAVAGKAMGGKRAFCKFWISNGSCNREGCSCDHPEGEALKGLRREYWESQRKRRADTANPDDPHRAETKKSHAQRAAVLAEWLCSVYGLDDLRQHGVLEIAGGRGDLAFELSVKRRIPCTVVDPRCPGNTEGLEVGPWIGWQLSKPQRLWLEATLPGTNGFDACQAYVESCPLRQCCACAPADLVAADEKDRLFWAKVAGDCRVVVGLHPDQATGSVLELARVFGRPFAVVPCCTFADDFPNRRLKDGRPVRTYEELVEWLRAYCPATDVDFLSFHGKNLVVYSRSGEADSASEREAQEASAASEKSTHVAQRCEGGNTSTPL